VLADLDVVGAIGLRIDPGEVAELAASLIRIPTIPSLHPGGEAEAIACLGEVLDREQIPYDVEEVLPGRPNLVIELGEGAGPTLWLNGHIDTVPIGNRMHWRHEPFGGDEYDGSLFGRGASDCKGGVAAMIHAAVAIRRCGARIPGRLILSAVMGEEEGQIGIRHLLDRGIRADGFVSTQWSTVSRVAVSYQGLCWLEITTAGRAAHGSRPHEGINAVEQMVSLVLPPLLAMRLPGAARGIASATQVNLAAIHGGEVANVVPDTCRALLDYRISPGQRSETLLRNIERILDELRLQHPSLDVSMKIVLRVEPAETGVNSRLIRVLSDAIATVTGRPPEFFGKKGTGDANLVHGRLGIPAIAYGPGNDSGHRPDEHVTIRDLATVAETYALLILTFCSAGSQTVLTKETL
jgi:succinyl-diaminopimelate desuccinylase